MFAPAAPLAKAVSKVRGDVETAEDLAHQATRTHEQTEEDGYEAPEDLDADEAGQLVDEEYRPLMGDDDEEGGSSRPSNGQRRDSKARDAEGSTLRTRKLEVWITKLAFFVSSSLFPLATLVAPTHSAFELHRRYSELRSF